VPQFQYIVRNSIAARVTETGDYCMEWNNCEIGVNANKTSF
jgi:hypothetical protein